MKPNDMKYEINKLSDAFYNIHPDYAIINQRVKFGTSGHRGISTEGSFNEHHILAICQSICDFRLKINITGPIFLGIDTHALSVFARNAAIEIFAANNISVIFEGFDAYTPTPVISHAILAYNKKNNNKADGIIITPSHNPPQYGGLKYNPFHGGGADTATTEWIQNRANEYLLEGIHKLKRISRTQASSKQLLIEQDLLGAYIEELDQVLNIDAISASSLTFGVDPLGGASIAFWQRIIDKYKLTIDIICDKTSPDFNFVPADKDGEIRMDCSSPWAMSRMIAKRKNYDLSFGNDTDADRHAIVAQTGLLHTNDYLAIALDYLHKSRVNWQLKSLVGKSVVTSDLISAVAYSHNREVYESPVGCKWFATSLFNGEMTFGGEESAGGTFLRKNGQPWSTDKDGLIMNLLAAEILSVTGRNLQEYRQDLERQHGVFSGINDSISINRDKLNAFQNIDFSKITPALLGKDIVIKHETTAKANNKPIGGIKWTTKNGWSVVRVSGTEPMYKIYVESFIGKQHAQEIFDETKRLIETNLND
jgi:phosphoglucomutase